MQPMISYLTNSNSLEDISRWNMYVIQVSQSLSKAASDRIFSSALCYFTLFFYETKRLCDAYLPILCYHMILFFMARVWLTDTRRKGNINGQQQHNTRSDTKKMIWYARNELFGVCVNVKPRICLLILLSRDVVVLLSLLRIVQHKIPHTCMIQTYHKTILIFMGHAS